MAKKNKDASYNTPLSPHTAENFLSLGEKGIPPVSFSDPHLIEVIQQKQVEELKKLIKAGVDLNIFSNQGLTPLDVAEAVLKAERKKINLTDRSEYDKAFDCFNLLRKAGAKSSDALYKSSLLKAEDLAIFLARIESDAHRGNAVSITELLKLRWGKKNPTKKNPDEVQRILDLAFEKEKPLILTVLTELGYDLNEPDAKGQTVLERAISEKNIPLFEEALNLGALDNYPAITMVDNKIPSQAKKLVRQVFKSDDFAIVKAFLSHPYTQNLAGDMLLKYAYEAGLANTSNAVLKTREMNKADVLVDFITHPLNPDERYAGKGDKNFSKEADEARHLVVIDLFFAIASQTPASQIPTTLSDLTFDPKIRQLPAYPLFLEKVISSKKLLNHQDENGVTLLMKAVSLKTEAYLTTEKLIQAGTDIHKKDNNNNTALHYACATGDEDVTLLLLQNGADVNAKGFYQHTPLHVSALLVPENTAVTHALLAHQALINAVNKDGMTPLMCAALKGSLETVKLLRKQPNSDETIQSQTGQTFFDILKQTALTKGVGYSYLKQEIKKQRALKNKAMWKNRLTALARFFSFSR